MENNFAGCNSSTMANKPAPCVKIIEQPARCALRFRYECEGRSAGSIPGSNATAENKTYPTIQVLNYKGPAVVVVSCVTKDLPYRPHPHNLVGKEGCKKGVCTMVIDNPEMICSFTSLGIQCVKRKDVEDSLKLRESIKVDPYRTGFSHKNQASNIDLNVVRLCFQVFIEGAEKAKFTTPLAPIVCEPIYDKKAMSELVITKLSHCSSPVSGGIDMILLCDRVTKDDVQIRFYEERNNQLIWEAFGEFQPNDVHKQVAICFRTPRYFDENVQQAVLVQMQLRRPSDMHTSDPRPFQFMPREIDPDGLTRKRQKLQQEGSLDRYMRDNNVLLPNSNILVANKSPSPAASPSHPHMDANAMVIDDPTLSMPRLSANEFVGVPRLVTKVKTEIQDDLSVSAAWTLVTGPPPPKQLSPHLHEMLPPSAPFSFSNQQIIHSFNAGVHQIQQTSNILSTNQAQHQGDQTAVPSTSSSTQASSAPLTLNLRRDAFATSSMMKSSDFAQAVAAFANMQQPNQGQQVDFKNPNNNAAVENTLTEKLDSLDLDIDPSDLMNDINFNNLMVMMDSGNNITFNSSGNIAEASGITPGSLNTPQMCDQDNSNRNLMASASQMARLQNELLLMQSQMQSKANQDHSTSNK